MEQTSFFTFNKLEEEKRVLNYNIVHFMDCVQQYDPNLTTEDKNAKDRPKNNSIVDFFCDDDCNIHHKSMFPTPPSQFAQQVNAAADTRSINELYRLLVLISLSDHEYAVSLCEKQLKYWQETLGQDDPIVATMLNIFAFVHYKQDKYKEAVNLLKDALAIREKSENHLAVAATLNYLAMLYTELNKYEEAEPLCKRALEIREKMLGHDHLDVAKQLNNMALLCMRQNKYEEVERYCQRAIEIYEAKLKLDDHIVFKTKIYLASCFFKQGKYKDAEILYKQILTWAHERKFSVVDSDLWCNKPIWQIAEETEENKRKNKEYVLYEPFCNCPVKDWRIIIVTLKNLGVLYHSQAKHEAAKILEDSALTLFRYANHL